MGVEILADLAAPVVDRAAGEEALGEIATAAIVEEVVSHIVKASFGMRGLADLNQQVKIRNVIQVLNNLKVEQLQYLRKLWPSNAHFQSSSRTRLPKM